MANCPCEVMVSTIWRGRWLDALASATGKFSWISVRRDQVVVSIKKINTTKSTSMNGIRLISGSGVVREVLKFTSHFQLPARLRCLAKRSAATSMASTWRSTTVRK